MKQPYFSAIIPVYNEEGNVEELFSKLSQVFSTLNKPWEVIFVNDGSTDKSLEVLNKLKSSHPQIKVITFTRNFGQTAAFAAGIDHAEGEILITLDADLQNDPQDIPRMYTLMQEHKADIVTGWRKNRKDPFLRSMLSSIANTIINSSMNSQIHDLGCSLRLYKKSVISHIQLYGEMHRFIPILAAANGATIIETEVTHHPRTKGKSKYGLTRTFKVILDLLTVKLLTGFQTKPSYLFGMSGFGFIFISFLIAVFVTIRALFLGGALISPLFSIGVIFFTFGILTIFMGLLAEIQVRTWYESSGKKSYIIKNVKE